MRAVTVHEGVLEVADLPVPEPGPGQVRLRVTRAGICGSDLHARHHADAAADIAAEVGYTDFMRRGQAVVLGHEFTGTVLDYGPYVAKCTPSYLNNEGRRPGNVLAALRSMAYMGSALDWLRYLEAWREEGSMRGLARVREPGRAS